MNKPVFFFLLVAALAIPAVPAWAEQDVSQQVRSLQQQIQALRNGSIQSNSSAAQAIASLQDLQTQFEALKASIDANAHLIRTHTDNMDLKLHDMDARIAALEERLAIQGKQVTTAVSTVAPEAAAEAELYQAGLNQINNSAFLKAIGTFKKFMTKFPKSDYSANAQYWIAECYFAMRDFEQAIKEFEILKEKYPRSDKVPAALLKQGYAFIELDMVSDAKLFLNNLIKRYPRTKESKEAKDRMERMEKLKESERKARTTGDVPLAPGVEVPDETKKNAQEKYR